MASEILNRCLTNAGGLARPHTILSAAACIVLIGCNSSQSSELDQDERVIEMVHAANDTAPPIRTVQPDSLLPEDIRRHDLTAPNCTFAVGTTLGPRVIAREADAYMKIGGEIQRFAADPGAQTIIGNTRSVYNGRTHVLRLEITAPNPDDAQGQAVTAQADGEGVIELQDPHGRVVYSGHGLVNCE